MKKQFIMLVMAGMLLVPYGTVFASSGDVGAVPVGYVFPTTQSMVVLGSDALSGTVLSQDEIVGYNYVPWVMVNPDILNVPVGYNLLDLFSYGCEGFEASDLSVKILIAPTYHETSGGAFVDGLFEDVTSNPVISAEGAYSYKIIVTKPGSDSPLSAVETGYIGVSSSVSASENTVSVDAKSAPLADSVAPAVQESVAPVSEVTTAPVEVTTPVEKVVTAVPEAVGSTDVSSDSVENTSDFTAYSEEAALSTSAVPYVYGGSPYSTDPKFMLRYDIWRVKGEVRQGYVQRCFELINIERTKRGLKPVLLDQRLVEGSYLRADECNLYYSHYRPTLSNGIKLPIDLGNDILTTGTSLLTPEDAVQSWMNSAAHSNVLLADYYSYVGVAQVNGYWVCYFRDSDFANSYRPATPEFLKKFETDNRLCDVVVDPQTHNYIFESGYVNSLNYGKATIDQGQSVTCRPYIKNVSTAGFQAPVYISQDTIKWTSLNPSIASVDGNGVITGRSSGITVVTGSANDQVVSYTITVTGQGTPTNPPTPENPIAKYLVKYRTHVQDVGWQPYVTDGKMAGTSGRSLRLEGINIALDPSVGGGIEYRTHVQNIGWQGYVANGTMSGTSGMSYRLEAINIRLTGAAAEKYDIYYRVHTQNIGWMGWAKNGEASGSAGFSYRLEGIEIQLVAKGSPAPGPTANAFVQK